MKEGWKYIFPMVRHGQICNNEALTKKVYQKLNFNTPSCRKKKASLHLLHHSFHKLHLLFRQSILLVQLLIYLLDAFAPVDV